MKNLAAKITILIAVLFHPLMMTPAHAIPVFDVANVVQNTISAINEVAQRLKQVQEYRTQLQQYRNMLQNTAAPVAYIWDEATMTMNDIRGTIDTMKHFKVTLGGIDSYLGQFKDTATYRNSPCFSARGCTAAQWTAMRNSEGIGSEAQKRATDALFRGLDKQQNAMEKDARTLKRIQSGAQGAGGQMQAIGYANQLASEQATQLLQIRALLIAQQNVVATRAQVLADREAREAAAGEQLRKGTYRASPIRRYRF